MGMRLRSITVFCTAWVSISAVPGAAANAGAVAQGASGEASNKRSTAQAMTLERALAIALRRSPQLRALGHDAEWSEGRMGAARAYPNPELAVVFEDLTAKPREEGSSPGNIKAELNQSIELGGKRSTRVRQAEVEGQSRTADSALARTRFRFDLNSAFIQVVHAQHIAGLAEERHSLASRIAEIAGERARAGKIAPIEETRLRTNAALASSELYEKRQELKTARLRLASVMGVEEAEFGEVVFPLEQLGDNIAMEKLRAELTSSNSFARIDLDVAKARADLEVEQANGVPNLTVILEANYQPNDKRTLFAAGFSLPLPVFDRNQGARGMAAAQVLATTALADKQRQDLAQEVEEAHATLTASLNKARILKTDVLPGLEQSQSALETAYRQGRIGYLDVVESQESLFAVREKALEAAARYHTSLFRIEALLSKTRTHATEASAEATDGVIR